MNLFLCVENAQATMLTGANYNTPPTRVKVGAPLTHF
jgi:hypothetical protein